MCDYSLHSVKTRPAKLGEKLTTHLFESGTKGFCGPEDTSRSRLPSAWDRGVIHRTR